MTQSELTKLREIANSDTFKLGPLLRNYLDTVKVSEEVKSPRTDAQHRALFLWFGMIEKTCAEQGVTWNMLIKHTVDVAVTKEGLHNFWKVLQEALFKTKSTKELKKTGQIDKMVEHFALFLGKEGVEVPPFPSDETKTRENMSGVRLAQINNLKNEDYEEMTEETSANKF